MTLVAPIAIVTSTLVRRPGIALGLNRYGFQRGGRLRAGLLGQPLGEPAMALHDLGGRDRDDPRAGMIGAQAVEVGRDEEAHAQVDLLQPILQRREVGEAAVVARCSLRTASP